MSKHAEETKGEQQNPNCHEYDPRRKDRLCKYPGCYKHDEARPHLLWASKHQSSEVGEPSLVERSRAFADNLGSGAVGTFAAELLREDADEIERLMAENARRGRILDHFASCHGFSVEHCSECMEISVSGGTENCAGTT